jgi:hypothetical protein
VTGIYDCIATTTYSASWGTTNFGVSVVPPPSGLAIAPAVVIAGPLVGTKIDVDSTTSGDSAQIYVQQGADFWACFAGTGSSDQGTYLLDFKILGSTTSGSGDIQYQTTGSLSATLASKPPATGSVDLDVTF